MRLRSMSRCRWERPRQSNRRLTRRALTTGVGCVNITEDVRKYAAEQGIAEEEALKKGREEKSAEFADKGSELYAKV